MILTPGITKAGEGVDNIVWNILGQTYVPKEVSETSMAWHATFPPDTFVPPHIHPTQDEFIYILQGRPTLHTDEGRQQLSPGLCAGFKSGTGNAHRLINETSEEVVYLEVGDRTPGDEGSYPDDDLVAVLVDGAWTFVHKDGTPYR